MYVNKNKQTSTLLLRAVRAAIRPGVTKFVFLESPTNPRMQVCDIHTISQMAHEVRAQTFSFKSSGV